MATTTPSMPDIPRIQAYQGDPTEGALIVAARKIGIAEAKLAERYERVGEVPFSSERKMMSVALIDARREGYLTIACKGAPMCDWRAARTSVEATPSAHSRRDVAPTFWR